MNRLAYTSNQILLGTFFGGPFAAIYFLKKNFDAMGDRVGAQKAIQYGLIAVASLLAIMPFLPQVIPGVVYAVAYAAASKAIYEQKQKTSLVNTPRYSHWNVLGVSIAAVIVFLIILVPLVYIYMTLGLMPSEVAADMPADIPTDIPTQ